MSLNVSETQGKMLLLIYLYLKPQYSIEVCIGESYQVALAAESFTTPHNQTRANKNLTMFYSAKYLMSVTEGKLMRKECGLNISVYRTQTNCNKVKRENLYL